MSGLTKSKTNFRAITSSSEYSQAVSGSSGLLVADACRVFFPSGFGFDDFADPTHGNVNYLKQSDATSRGLAYVDGDGIAVMKVDNTNTIATGGNRDS